MPDYREHKKAQQKKPDSFLPGFYLGFALNIGLEETVIH